MAKPTKISLGKCPICGRDMHDNNSNMHHLLPKLKGGKREGDNMVRLHVVCHSKIHSLWDENELRDVYNNIDTIMSDERIQKFAKFVSKKDPDYNDSSKMVKGHKRKGKR